MSLKFSELPDQLLSKRLFEKKLSRAKYQLNGLNIKNMEINVFRFDG